MRELFTLILSFWCTFLMGQKYSIEVDTIGYDCNFRGLCAVSNKVVWVTGSKGTVGKTTDGGETWQFQKVLDASKSEIRDVQAWDDKTALILSVTSPAEILKTTDGGTTWNVVFKATNSETFIDGFAFWDKNRGIAYGDPINGHFEIFTTIDAGDTWQQLAEEHSPKASNYEAAFASSGTGICVGKKGKVWFGTGGEVSDRKSVV